MSMAADAVEKETVYLVKPLIAASSVSLPDEGGFRDTYDADPIVKVGGEFVSFFKSKNDCLAWGAKSVKALDSAKKSVFAALCSNDEAVITSKVNGNTEGYMVPLLFDAGVFVGIVTYL